MLNKKALAASVSAPPAEYVEDVFSTYLYEGDSSNQTITNGIDLANEGGLVWMKARTDGSSPFTHCLFDTDRGLKKLLRTSSTAAQVDESGGGGGGITTWNSNGFTLTDAGFNAYYNYIGYTYASWTFRKAEKFFDVVTYTGNGSNRTISHNLGSVPGMIIVKRTDTTGAWQVYHRSLANTEYLVLNTTAAKATGTDRWNSTTPTSTEFSLGTNADVNANAGTYVAYLFAHNAGGFGTAGTDNIITCGSFTGASPATVNLGWEPQWLLIKSATNADNWYMFDTMRGWTANNSGLNYLIANTSGAEQLNGSTTPLTSTGFQFNYGSGETFIYMAIRRPMKTPTSGTEVYKGITRTGTGANATITGVGFAPDAFISFKRAGGISPLFWDRLRSGSLALYTQLTIAEYSSVDGVTEYGMDGVSVGADTNTQGINQNTSTYINNFFRRATGFFDIVCYTGTGTATTVTHNLGVVPELIIVKQRNSTNPWRVYSSPTLATTHLALNTDASTTTSSANWNDTVPTSSVFTVGTGTGVNGSGNTYVAYLFASLNGVSKVGSYTGNGSNQTINCGFTAGARFVLIKRTDSTGDWCVFDTARGIVSGNDPFLQLNSTAAEVTGEDAVDPDNSGFIVNETTEALNTNNATYIYLAIA